MRKYQKYKETEVKGIPAIPKEWVINKIKFVSKTIAGGTPDTKNIQFWENGTIPWLPSGKVHDCNIYEEDADTFITELGLKGSAAKLIPTNSILIALTGATCANIAHLHFSATANQSVVAMPGSKKIENRYLFYCLLGIREQILINKTGGAQSGINDGDIKNTQIPYPSLPEQHAIVRFLDYKTGQIDSFITNRQKQIELLKEQSISTIDNAMTDNNQTLSNLLIQHKGIPKSFNGWSISKIKYCLSNLFLGLASSVDYVENANEGFPLVRATDFTNGYLTFDDVKYISIAQHKKITKFRKAQLHDILFSKSGTIGTVAIVNDKREFSIYESVFVLRANKSKILYKFLYYILQANYFKMQYLGGSVGMGVAHLNLGDIKENFITFPDLNTQKEIIEILENDLNKIDTLISKYQKQIDLMQEYRTSLISQAVTGKIDVREWQPKKQQTV